MRGPNFMLRTPTQTIRHWNSLISSLLGFVALVFTGACQKGIVTVSELPMFIDGLSIPEASKTISTTNLKSFMISGLCDSNIDNIYFRFDESSSWISILDPAVGGQLKCNTNRTFSFHFSSAADTKAPSLAAASGYSPRSSNKPPSLNVFLMGKSGTLKTKTITVLAQEKGNSGGNRIVLSPQTQFNSANIIIKGRLVATKSSAPFLESTPPAVKIKHKSQ